MIGLKTNRRKQTKASNSHFNNVKVRPENIDKKRVLCSVTEIAVADKTYRCAVEGAYEEENKHFITVSIMTSNKFNPENAATIRIKKPYGSNITLACRVMWYLRSVNGTGKVFLCMKILNPPPGYKLFLNHIPSESSGDIA